jgi:CheY-like chemotaxis protein
MAGPCKIMVVDDELSVSSVTRMTLESGLDSIIVEYNDPIEALEHLADEDYGVLLTDFQMPGMNGLELAEKAVEVNSDIVVILVSAFVNKEILMEMLNKGAVWKCLEKPWKSDKIIDLAKEGVELYENKALGDAPDADAASGGDDGKIVIQKGALKGRSLARGGKKRVVIKGKSPRTTPAKKRIVVKGKGAPATTKHSAGDGSFTSDRYTSFLKIGEGGSGILYKAEDTLLGMPVVIKLLSPHIAKNPESIAELFAEARLAMQLSHKHIVRLHNIEEHNGAYYLVMEYIDGVTMHEYLYNEGPLSDETLTQVLEVLDDAISYAHRHKIYHRDLKPANIMITKEGVLKIIDYGLGCLAGQEANDVYICGTPFYISPEALEKKPVDGRSDLFSIAIMAHELFTGDLPIAPGQKDVNMHDFVPQCFTSVPLDIKKVLKKGWARDPDQRYESLHAFVKAMKKAL